MALFVWLKLAHVLAAIVAVGANATYAIWFATLKRAPEAAQNVTRTIYLIEQRVANVAYVLLLLTGLGMAAAADMWSERWIHLALGLYVLVVVVALAVYSPILRRQQRALEEDGPESARFALAIRQAQKVGGMLMVMVIAIVALMVLKPAFGAPV